MKKKLKYYLLRLDKFVENSRAREQLIIKEFLGQMFI